MKSNKIYMEQQLLRDASNEIKNLRRDNQLMRARLEMFDSMMAVLGTTMISKVVGMSPDIVYEIDKYLESKTQ